MSNSQPQTSPQSTKNAYVYVDGFNLYYGALNNRKSKGLKWLNLESLCQKLFPGVNIKKIKYFTAGVSGKFDVNKPVRQRIYWRALKTISDLEIIEGRFLIVPQKIHITQDVYVVGKVPEEKGTDVNLAIHLVNDAHLKKFDVGIVISNDSDLAGAIKIVTQELNISVNVANPYEIFNKQIIRYATSQKKVRRGAVLNSQFAQVLTDSAGTFSKPSSW